MTEKELNARLEYLADEIEGAARQLSRRTNQNGIKVNELFKLAWDIKQNARAGTPSEGV